MDHERAIKDLAVECYLLGEMTPAEREAFEQHYFECPACAEDIREAVQLMADAKDVLGEEAGAAAIPAKLPEAPRPQRNWFSWLHPQFAAAAILLLAIVCVVESVSIPNLRRRADEAVAPRVVNSAFLKPQTRGAAAVLKAGAGEPVILMLDPPESAFGKVEIVVKSADGQVQLRFPADMPSAGEPLILSIPKLDLTTGNYLLLVESPAASGQNGQELGRYPFELQRR